ncbi:MAG: flagellar motor switch protein FliG [Myxococcota bacterium]|nr:flagellar motor switch protein FliG [Myxococcota bacterium]
MAEAAATESELSGAQRAAILVMYLDREVAKGLLRQLDDDDVRAVGLAMGSIENVDPAVIEAVIGDFVRDLHEVSMMPRSGPDFVAKVLPQLLDETRRNELLPIINRRVNKEFEQFISMRPAASVAAMLRDEPPQTQAVALCLMGPENAAMVLKHLPEETKTAITVRMARLKRIPGELADDVIVALRAALGKQDDHLDVGGVDRTARILGRMSRNENGAILEGVSDEDPDLADSLRRRMIVFEDLVQLTNMAIQVVLKQVDRDDMVLALKGASSQLQDLFLANVSSRAADDIREEMEIMGPVPRSRIRAAQERIVAAALTLAEEGSIYLPMGAEDEED